VYCNNDTHNKNNSLNKKLNSMNIFNTQTNSPINNNNDIQD